MPTETKPQVSFSPWRKWSIGLNVFLIILSALVIVVALNYLSRDHFLRLQCSTRANIQLAPRTLSLLHSITNQVKVILYYDKKEPLYSTVLDVLNQYALVNPKISVQTVDYVRDAAAAQKVRTDYKLVLSDEKNVVIFDCEGRVIPMDGKALTHYIIERVPNEKQIEVRRKPAEFEGESRFSAALLAITHPKPLNAYFVQGHREHSPESGGDYGYVKFVDLVKQNYVSVQPFSLLGTNALDCNLLIVAGANEKFFEPELEKIDSYLAQGGRMLVLFNAASIDKETGLEKTGLETILAKWGVEVGTHRIQDPDHSVGTDYNMIVTVFNQKHPLVNPLLGSGRLYITAPRAIAKLKAATQTADASRVEELAFTGPRAVAGNSGRPQAFPLMVAVEKGAIQGVITERGATRIVVTGDSLFLANGWIDLPVGNRDFADAAINWLLNRAQLLEGIGPRPVKEYKIIMTNSQLQQAEWILLAGLPGGVLTLGGMVWLRRRK